MNSGLFTEAGFWQTCAELAVTQSLKSAFVTSVYAIFTDAFSYSVLRLTGNIIEVSDLFTPFVKGRHTACTDEVITLLQYLLDIISWDSGNDRIIEMIRTFKISAVEHKNFFSKNLKLNLKEKTEGKKEIILGMKKKGIDYEVALSISELATPEFDLIWNGNGNRA